MPDPTVPPFHGNISFHAHHSPVGAGFTFTCGHFGSRGGLAVRPGKPADQDVYIGVKEGDRGSDAPLRCLPFYDGADADTDPRDAGAQVVSYRREQIRRHYGWATDRWVTPQFEFVIRTPFREVADPTAGDPPALRHAHAPAVFAELIIDNRDGGAARTGVFALGVHEPGVRPTGPGLSGHSVGFALGHQAGVASFVTDYGDPPYPEVKPFLIQGQSPAEALHDRNPVHLLGPCAGIAVEVPPGRKFGLVLALGVYRGGAATTRLEGRYGYAHSFNDLADVLGYALASAGHRQYDAAALDAALSDSPLSPDQQFLLAHATRAYYANTHLLDVGGQPYWVVADGDAGLLNALDVAVDLVFWELKHNPWVVRNLLDGFLRRYSYTDRVKDPRTGALSPGGLSFCHDQGVHNQFAPFGHSAYELANVTGRFSYTTQEQLCNWILIAACYAAKTDDVEWLRHHEHVLDACLRSMLRRDHPDPEKRNGVMSFDSDRCGPDGREVTTYADLDPAVAQAGNNLYLAVKCWAAYLGLQLMFGKIGRYSEAAEAAARYAANTVAGQMRDAGFVPAVVEKDHPGYDARVLSAVEGLAYPLYWRSCDPLNEVAHAALNDLGDYRSMLDVLRGHAAHLLNDPERRNHFPDGGLRLSSTSDVTWVSKAAIVQHVMREVFKLEDGGDDRQRAAADAAHVRWQTEGEAARCGTADQLRGGDRVAGGQSSPRGVTTVLWLKP